MRDEVNIETPLAPAGEPSIELGPSASGNKTPRRQRTRLRRNSPVRPDATPHEHWGIFQPVPRWVWWLSAAFAGWGVFTANPVLTPCAVLMLPVFASLLWFRGEPTVLLFGCFMQWVQASAAIFYTNFYGVSLEDASGSRQMVEATWLTLIAVLVVAIGMRLALFRRKKEALARAVDESKLLQPDRIFILYLLAFVFSYGVTRLAYRMPSIAQPVFATLSLKWVLLFLLAYAVLVQERYFPLLAISVCLEFVSGLLGFFAGFKDIFFLLLVVLTSTHFVIKGWRLVQLCMIAVMMVVFGAVWTAIKVEYREFLNQGSGQQEVQVSVDARAEKLGELVGEMNRFSFADGLQASVIRLSYVNYLAMCLANVPAVVPHEHGALWGGAIIHVLTPRVFFPNKPALDDSAQTSYYTGREVAGAEQGTSIGLGYVAQSYIDFGKWGMFAPILLLGAFYGATYRLFASARHKILGLAMATGTLIFSASKVEVSNVKIVGGNTMALIVMGLFATFAGPTLWSWVTAPKAVLPTRRRRVKLKKSGAPVGTGE